MINRLWTACCLFAVVSQLAVIRGFDIRQVLLFGVPVLLALAVASQEATTRGRLLARLFLVLIGLGLVIAKIPWVFPKLGGMDQNLPPESDRALTWYCAVYLLYFSFVLPIHLFSASLRQLKQGKPAQFSAFTCYLGLFASAVVGPGMVCVAVEFFHLLPIV
jgi:hypothetical protein